MPAARALGTAFAALLAATGARCQIAAERLQEWFVDVGSTC